MFLASALILPIGSSYALDSNVTATTPYVTTLSNQTMTNQTMATLSNQTMTNQTMATLSNQTMTNQTTSGSPVSTNSVTYSKDVQQIYDFIHQSVVDFKQQNDETRHVIFDCRDKIQNASPADINNIRADCTTQLSAIKAKYQDERSHFHDLVKKYRQSVMVFLREARGFQVYKVDIDKAFANLNATMNMQMSGNLTTGPVSGLMAKTNNTKCINPPGGPAIC
jgi:hypothetical protein